MVVVWWCSRLVGVAEVGCSVACAVQQAHLDRSTTLEVGVPMSSSTRLASIFSLPPFPFPFGRGGQSCGGTDCGRWRHRHGRRRPLGTVGGGGGGGHCLWWVLRLCMRLLLWSPARAGHPPFCHCILPPQWSLVHIPLPGARCALCNHSSSCLCMLQRSARADRSPYDTAAPLCTPLVLRIGAWRHRQGSPPRSLASLLPVVSPPLAAPGRLGGGFLGFLLSSLVPPRLVPWLARLSRSL